MKVEESDIAELAEDLLALPISDRAFLAEKLVESIDHYSDPEIEAAWAKEIARRVREYEEGKVHGIPSEEVMSEARRRLDEVRQVPS